MSDTPTDRQFQILKLYSQPVPPTYREVAAKLEMKTSTGAYDGVQSLIRKGYLVKAGEGTRSIILTGRGRKALGIRDARTGVEAANKEHVQNMLHELNMSLAELRRLGQGIMELKERIEAEL